MFVTNHVLSGVVIGRLLPRAPGLAFAVGVASHLALDATPHWGCNWDEPGGFDHFLRVARRDGLMGLATMGVAAIAVEKTSRVSTVAAMTGAALLDLDKPCALYLGWNPFPRFVRRIHMRLQNESPKGMRNELGFGLACAAIEGFRIAKSRDRASVQRASPGEVAALLRP